MKSRWQGDILSRKTRPQVFDIFRLWLSMCTRAPIFSEQFQPGHDRITYAGDSLERERKSVAKTAATMMLSPQRCVAKRSTLSGRHDWSVQLTEAAMGYRQTAYNP
ncbi:MAG: hypothetical protein D4R88_00490 [Methanosarcinales archaeon]|nr:MAG: hypothetical protein D4R88_00490 [Methanosarcinales archaeon]